MEMNGLAAVTTIISRLLRQETLDGDLRADLETCLKNAQEQVEYCRAAEFQLVQLVRHFKKERYCSDLVPKFGYPKSYQQEFINEELQKRLDAIAVGGKQCLICGAVSQKDADSCPSCGLEFTKVEEHYDRTVRPLSR